MKKAILFVAVSAFLSFTTLASADNTVPGSYDQAGSSAGIGVSFSMMQMGAADRALTNAVNLASGAGKSRSDTGPINGDFQFGSSQTEQSWKAARTIEEAQVRGLVPGDCQGDNSDGAYRQQMNQNRNGYMKERLVSNAQCAENHPTLK
jgi:hypothetical protein